MGSEVRRKDILVIDPSKTGENISTRLKEDGYNALYCADLAEGYEKLEREYFQLAILTEAFVHKYQPTPDKPYFPQVRKILRREKRSFKKETGVSTGLETSYFEDEFYGGDVDCLITIVKKIYNNHFQKFSWNLQIEDKHGKTEDLLWLPRRLRAADTSSIESLALELTDLLRFLYHDEEEIVLFPVLWIKNGLAALEVLCTKPKAQPLHHLLLIGATEQVENARCGYRNHPSTTCIETGYFSLYRFGVIQYTLVNRHPYQWQLISASDALRQRIDPSAVAHVVFALSTAALAGDLSHSDEVEPIRKIWEDLQLPDIETIKLEMLRRASQSKKEPCWIAADGIKISVDETEYSEAIQLRIKDIFSFEIKMADLCRILENIQKHHLLRPVMSAVGASDMSTILVETDVECLSSEIGHYWATDFRISDPYTCVLSVISSCAAELRYSLVRSASLEQRLILEQNQVTDSDAPKLAQPSLVAAQKYIRNIRFLLKGQADDPLFHSTMLLQAIARFLHITPTKGDVESCHNAAHLLASIAMFTNYHEKLFEQFLPPIRAGQRSGEFVINGQTIWLNKVPAHVFNLLLKKGEDGITYHEYYQSLPGKKPSRTECRTRLQKQISLIRAEINRKYPGYGSKLIETITGQGGDAFEDGYRLVMDIDFHDSTS